MTDVLTWVINGLFGLTVVALVFAAATNRLILRRWLREGYDLPHECPEDCRSACRSKSS